MPDRPSISVEAAEEVMRLHFPAGLGGTRTIVPREEVFLAVDPLTRDDITAMQTHMASGGNLDVKPVDLKQVRHTHHRLAQLLAVGVDEFVAAKLCNYSFSRVSMLKSDPAFAELLAHYTGDVQDQWADFVGTAANLSLDVLQEMQRRLDETPEQLTPTHLIELGKFLADRTGHAPVQKSIAVNVNADVGSRLQAARERLRSGGG